MRDEKARVALGAMDSCRISWGKVMGVEGQELIVERPELTYSDGHLHLSEPRVTRVTRQHKGRGFIDEAKVGDVVTIHWGWACDMVTPGAVRRLRQATDQCLALANTTI
jgi:hypothetical protein